MIHSHLMGRFTKMQVMSRLNADKIDFEEKAERIAYEKLCSIAEIYV